ncbi:MAG: hypothetical protein KatS3mg093_452 [Candidatus Parcubacteria bacterium]|nr:MAG: hypothetical protein KatS3mg093_452 [Candidatus Parcubacteria bacterium]
MIQLSSDVLINRLFTYFSIEKKNFRDLSKIFFGEPSLYYYIYLNNHERNKLFSFFTGVSFFSRELAFQKCFFELLEKKSFLLKPKEEKVIFKKLPFEEDFYQNNVIFEEKETIQKIIETGNIKQVKKMSLYFEEWIEGEDLTNNKQVLLPAQLIYPYLSSLYSSFLMNGAAADYNKKNAIIRAIYETIERDAKVNLFIKKKFPKKLSKKILCKIKPVFLIIKKYHQYRLKPVILDITSDLNIPVFMTVLFDFSETNNPFVSFGYRAGLDIEEAIIGSLEDAFFSRIIQKLRNRLFPYFETNKIVIFLNKRKVYIPEYSYNYIQSSAAYYLLNSFSKITTTSYLYKNKFKKKLKVDEQLRLVLSMLKEKGYKVYIKDISPQILSTVQVFVIKAIIPGLHPNFNYEGKSIFFCNRLVSKFSHL